MAKGRPYSSLAGIIKRLGEIRQEWGDDKLFFRGHSRASYKLLPTIYRKPWHYKHEDYMIRELLAAHPEDFASDQNMFEKLVRAQHYELPTRLLDMTTNPLVALYFAVQKPKKRKEEEEQGEKPEDEPGSIIAIAPPRNRIKYYDSDTVCIIANLALVTPMDRKLLQGDAIQWKSKIQSEMEAMGSQMSFPFCQTITFTDLVAEGEVRDLWIKRFNERKLVTKLVHQIRGDKPHFRALIDPEDVVGLIPVVPRQLNPRIRSQNGTFLLFGLIDDDTQAQGADGYIEKNNDWKIQRITIAKDAKPKIRDDLAAIGITEASLFPEMSRSASQIAEKTKELSSQGNGRESPI